MAWNGLGNILDDAGKHEEAIAAYEQVLKIDSNYKYVWNQKGHALYDFQRYKEAIEADDKAIDIDPDDKYAWNAKGNTFNALCRC